VKQKIEQLICAAAGVPVASVVVPERQELGHYATNLAMRLAKERGASSLTLAKEIAEKVSELAPAGFFEKVEAAPPGFVNFWLAKETLQREIAQIAAAEHYGMGNNMKGQTVMVEYTDPNPFKQFHIGHLMSNAIGESLARLFEATGANVLRVNWQGDVGLHIAMAVWGMKRGKDYLGEAYTSGAEAYQGDDAEAKKEIEEINRKLYGKSDPELNALYGKGRKGSLDYFEKIYERLGTKFDHYFFESEMGPKGLEIVQEHPEVFEESEGAVVFHGEPHGLHTRVFVNSQGIPTYEAKELGLNQEKFNLYHPDLSVIVTGNEINDYFKVLIKVMEFVLPEVAERTRHVGHGMLRLPGGKMSSRTGNVITAEELIEKAKSAIAEKENKETDIPAGEREAAREKIAIGAIKYSILKQGIGQDIVFDFEKSLSLKGDSGPYLQYTYARFMNIMRKSSVISHKSSVIEAADYTLLNAEAELAIVRKVIEFPATIETAAETFTPNVIAKYLHELANLANQFYETTPIIKDEHDARRNARLALVLVVTRTLKSGLNMLGIAAPEKI